MVDALKTSQAALWIQPGGANTIPYFLGCHTLDDVSEPLGGTELVRKFKPDGSGWQTVATKKAPPDPVGTTITTLIYPSRDWIELLRCPGNLFIMHRDCGAADVFSNYVRGEIVKNFRVTNRTYGQMVNREEDLESTVAIEIEGEPPLIDIDLPDVTRVTTAEALSLNAIYGNVDVACQGSCGISRDYGEYVYIGADGGAGTPNGYYSLNFLASHAAFAADPFIVAGEHIAAIARFQRGRTAFRLIATKQAVGGAQGRIAYSDDNGASWTIVTIGGAVAGHGTPLNQRGLYVYSENLILLASGAGYIYRSLDGGATWTAVEAGVIGVNPYNAVHMCDDTNAIAVGGGADVIAVSDNSGLTWAAAAANPGSGAALNTCAMIDNKRWWVGTANGRIYYTLDGGATWTRRTGWTGEGVGQVRDMFWLNELVGYMVVNTAAPVGTVLRTINGGYTWATYTTPTNSGLNSIHASKWNLAYAVGETNGGTGVLLKVAV